MSKLIADEMCDRLKSNDIIKSNLVSIIWFGSIHNNQDVHDRSDCDLQVILQYPEYETIAAMNKIFESYPDVDLSIMYLHDIYDTNQKLIFHDGTKSLFFIHVLAAGTPIYGENIYRKIADSLTLEQIKPSLLMTIREYLGRLRVMAARNIDDPLNFKKYSLKMFKDILIFDGVELPSNITRISNLTAINTMKREYTFDASLNDVLNTLVDYKSELSRVEIARLMIDYEKIVTKVMS